LFGSEEAMGCSRSSALFISVKASTLAMRLCETCPRKFSSHHLRRDKWSGLPEAIVRQASQCTVAVHSVAPLQTARFSPSEEGGGGRDAIYIRERDVICIRHGISLSQH
jgi:hypothetical protein